MAVNRVAVAEALDAVLVNPISVAQMAENQRTIDAAAALLRQTCAGCRHFEAATGNDYEMPVIVCQQWHPRPDDGSGHCHEWRAK
jgi:hypothetical protein